MQVLANTRIAFSAVCMRSVRRRHC